MADYQSDYFKMSSNIFVNSKCKEFPHSRKSFVNVTDLKQPLAKCIVDSHPWINNHIKRIMVHFIWPVMIEKHLRCLIISPC